jgi:PncC family amidohydrolase
MACGAVTSVEGASEVLDFSVVTYSNQAKIDYTGVTEEILSQNGAASERTASLMADGIRKRAASDIGVGITGIAGPGGGTPEKPVGTVYISVDNGFKPMTERFMFGGGRQSVREQTVKQAMIMTIKSIEFINKSK